MINTETEKLYSPLNIHLRDKEDAQAGVYDDIHYWRDELSHQEAVGYLDEIELFLRRDLDRFGTDRGIMAYCRSDVLSENVYSLIPSVELHGDRLWMVADVRLNEPLTPRDMADLKSWWGGQLSDGWGEGIGQREIKVDRGDLYIEPWTSSAGFFIATREEFAQRFGIDRTAPHSPAAEAEQAAPGDSAGERPLTEQKLYSPVYCELMDTDNDEYGSDYESSPIPQTEAAYYAGEGGRLLPRGVFH